MRENPAPAVDPFTTAAGLGWPLAPTPRDGVTLGEARPGAVERIDSIGDHDEFYPPCAAKASGHRGSRGIESRRLCITTGEPAASAA